MAYNVLLVEDDDSIAVVVTEALREEGYDVTVCSSLAARDAVLAERSFDIMLTDIVLGDGDGLNSIGSAREMAPDMPVIVLSAQNTLDTAIRVSDSDVFEYFPKPFDLDELSDAVRRAVADRSNASEAFHPEDTNLPLIGRSPAMQTVYRMITRVLRNDLTVLITGESGTGKELVAEAIHTLGSRRTGPFVAVNMAAIPHDLLESELFGHERGAFTGAVSQQIGKFEQANGGTLFLDEIGDMPIDAQTRLLRALQANRIRRVGGRHEIGVDVRIVAATNRDLLPMISEGRFREDLYYRLNVVPLHLPPLRERREDIGALTTHFLSEAAAEGLPHRQISEDAIVRLAEKQWRGNVRELRNVVFRLTLLSRHDVIEADDIGGSLPSDAPEHDETVTVAFKMALSRWLQDNGSSHGSLYHDVLMSFEKTLFEHALRQTDGNQVRAAQLLGINRNTLRKRLNELCIAPRSFAQRS